MKGANSRHGGILAGVLITGLSIVCLLVLIGLSIARNVRVDTAHREGGDDVSIETPAGSFSIHAHDKTAVDAIDVPSYPGAVHRPNKGGGATFEWTSRDGDETGMTVAGDELITEDSPEKVMAFYREQDPNWMVAERSSGEIKLELRDGGYRRFVVIHPKLDGTHIGVASIGVPAAN